MSVKELKGGKNPFTPFPYSLEGFLWGWWRQHLLYRLSVKGLSLIDAITIICMSMQTP
jgi:hypothetical protein